jgi:hypothetical protein
MLHLVRVNHEQGDAKMRTLIVVCAAAFVPLAGCAVTGDSNDATGARLPAGVTLLESDQDRCAGVVHVDDRSTSTSREIVVRQGQNAAFRVDGDPVRWTCIGETTANEDRVVCPDETSYVRITRPAASEEFLVECFG